jgi:hypothetical protein
VYANLSCLCWSYTIKTGLESLSPGINGNNSHVTVGRTLSYKFIIPFRSLSKELTGAGCDTTQKLSQDIFDAGSSFSFCFAADETPSYSVVTAEVRTLASFTSLGGSHPPEGIAPWLTATVKRLQGDAGILAFSSCCVHVYDTFTSRSCWRPTQAKKLWP